MKQRIYDELSYAEKLYQYGLQSTVDTQRDITYVAIYMRRVLGYKPKNLRPSLMKYCEKHWTGFNYLIHYKIITNAVNTAKKKNSTLLHIVSLPIYEDEFAYIQNLKLQQSCSPAVQLMCRKFLFTLVCQAKLNILIRAQRGHISLDTDQQLSQYITLTQYRLTQLRTVGKLTSTKTINQLILPALVASKHITPCHNSLVYLNFMNDINACYQLENREVKFYIKHFDMLGWYYEAYSNEKTVKHCTKCGTPFRSLEVNRHLCDDCRRKPAQETRQEVCAICGKVITVPKTIHHQLYCTDCAIEIKKEQNRLRIQKYRERNRQCVV